MEKLRIPTCPECGVHTIECVCTDSKGKGKGRHCEIKEIYVYVYLGHHAHWNFVVGKRYKGATCNCCDDAVYKCSHCNHENTLSGFHKKGINEHWGDGKGNF